MAPNIPESLAGEVDMGTKSTGSEILDAEWDPAMMCRSPRKEETHSEK